MSLSKTDVEKIASLARLELTDAEKALYQEQLSAILDYAQRLNQLDLTDVPPTSSAVDLKNVTRDDLVEPGLSTEDVFHNAFRSSQDHFKIQAVFEELQQGKDAD